MKHNHNIKLMLLSISLLAITLFSFTKPLFLNNEFIVNDNKYIFKNHNWFLLNVNSNNDSELYKIDTTRITIKSDSNITKKLNLLNNLGIQVLDSFNKYYLCKTNQNLLFKSQIDSLLSDSLEIIISDLGRFNSSDQYYQYQTYLNSNYLDIDYLRNDLGYGTSNITVAVIDAFIDWSHQDLGDFNSSYQNIWVNNGEDSWNFDPNNPSFGNGIDDDNNGYIDDYIGYDFYNNDKDVRPDANFSNFNKHGTLISGIISAKTNNTIGVAGIAGGNNSQGVKIMPLNIAPTNTTINSDQYSADKFSLAKAIKYAAHKGAKIITITATFAPNTYSPLVNEAINEAVDLYDCIIICASGNGSGSINQVHYPANNAKVIAVGAYVPINQGSTTTYSNTYTHGQELDFTALAMQSNSQGQYYGLAPNNQYYQAAGGTSIATAQISGMIALILSNYECIPKDDLIEILKSNSIIPNTSQCVPNSENWCDKFGYGTPNLSQIRDELNNRYLNSHNIINNTTITDLRFANNDIIINSDKKLTITGKLVMKNGTKIIVQPRGILEITNGGEITSNCEWIGVEVYGDSDPSTPQSISYDGVVYINTRGKISSAKFGIKSIGEALIFANNALFNNNYISVFVTPMYNNYIDQSPNMSTLKNSTFQITKHLKSTIYNNGNNRNSYEAFVKIDNSRYYRIDSCYFIDNFNSIKGIAINSFKTDLVVTNCSFINVHNGIESFSIYSLTRHHTELSQIGSNSFINVDRAIGMYGSKSPRIFTNYIQLGLTSNKTINNGVLEQNWGIAVKNSKAHINDNHILGAEDLKGYGTFISNDDIFKLSGDKLFENIIEQLSIGSQFEFDQKYLQPYCNTYLGMFERSWSISPKFSDKFVFPTIGSALGGIGGNLFYDLPANKEKHIKSRKGFIYYSSTDQYAEPTDVSNSVIINLLNINNAEHCNTKYRYDPCDYSNCNPNDLIELLSNETDNYYKSIIIDKIIELYYENNDFASIRNFALSHYILDSNINECIAILLEIGEFSYANDLLQNYPVLTQTQSDFKYILELYLSITQNHISLDSLDQSVLVDLDYISSHNNEASFYSNHILKFSKGIEFDQNPNLWEDSEEYINDIPSKEPIISQKSVLTNEKIILFPNPSNSSSEVLIKILNHKGKINNIELYNALGVKIDDISLNIQTNIFKLGISNYEAGIYFMSVKLENGLILTEKFIINE